MATKSTATQIFQLKITLRYTKPSIWRRVEVPADTTLADLHYTVQIAMGWTGGHLHAFELDGRSFSVKEEYMPEMDFDDSEDAASFKLSRAFPAEKVKIRYEYDFGDGWEHDIVLEKILALEAGVHYPRCTGGKMACPPEDCGGVHGYYGLLEILKDPKDEEYKETRKWLGAKFDPEAFSVEKVNKSLK